MIHYGGATPVVGRLPACSGPQWPIIRAMCEIPILVWVTGNYVCCTVNNAAKDNAGNVNSSGECVLPTTEPMQDASPHE